MGRVAAIAAFAPFVAAACGGTDVREPAGIPVRVQEVRVAGGAGGVRYSANVVPRAQVDVAFKANGYVDGIRQVRGADGRTRDLQQGDAVTSGVTLAHIRDEEYRNGVQRADANLARAQASFDKANEDFKRATALQATNSITGTNYDSAKEEYESAKAAVDAAKAQLGDAKISLSYTTLVAPMNGVILQRKIEVGTLVGPGSVGFVLADVSSVKVVFGVPDVMLSTVELGRKIGIATASLPGKSFTGTVTAVSPSADQSTRVSEIEVTVPNPQGELRDGMVASLEVPGAVSPAAAARAQAMAVPLAAVVPGDGDKGYAVFVLHNAQGKTIASRRPVELGPVAGSAIIVTSGLKPGDTVVVTGATIVRDGDAVRPIP